MRRPRAGPPGAIPALGLYLRQILTKSQSMRSKFGKSIPRFLAVPAFVVGVVCVACAVHKELNARIQSTIPEWAQDNTATRSGNALKVVCSGQGPSIDQARKYAVRSCKSSAVDFLRSDLSVRGVTVESETGVAVHQEIRENAWYTGLACKPLQDEVRPVEGGLFEVWLKCEFDMAKVRKSDMPADDAGDESPVAGSSTFSQSGRQDLVRQRELRFDDNSSTGASRSASAVLDIVSIPPCESLVVRGRKPRPLKCSGEGVTSVTVDPGDVEIIVRATGFLSKSVRITPGPQRHETVQVILDPAN